MKKLKDRFQKNWQDPGQRWFFLGFILAALILGLLLGGGSSSDPSQHQELDHQHGAAAAATLWTCSMHPQIKQPKAGSCPICGMDLIPAASQQTETKQGELKLTPQAIRLAEIRTTAVKRQYVSSNVRLVGKIQYDETRLKYISAWVPGRIDRMYVNFTGIRVRKGDHLVSLYSPELISAQQELIQASRIGGSTLKAVKEKLRLWGLNRQQIDNLQQKSRVEDHLTIYSPISGIVIHKKAQEGMYVKTGTPVYTIADLTKVWLIMDAYETDLAWIRYGQMVEFTTEALPGERFKGKIAFIDPVLNSKTRTVKIRVNVANSLGRLKPGMLVHAVLQSKLSESGQVVDENLAGKWISPMHPEIVKDGPGKCDICGMALVQAEKLGYVSQGELQQQAPLVIPASAPLITGTRAIVYLKVEKKEGVFSGKEVILGPRAGDYYIVKQGLKEGDEVVVHGAFKIDSDLQIQAQPSMMNPQGGGPPPGHDHERSHAKTHQHKEETVKISKSISTPVKFQHSLSQLVESYLKVQQALSSDDLKTALVILKDFQEKLGVMDMNLLTGQAHMEWMKIEKELKHIGQQMLDGKDIGTVRTLFSPLSNQMILVAESFIQDHEKALFRIHCPMALDNKGAYWLQGNAQTRNPYFGQSMLICQDEIVQLKKGKWQKKKK